MLGVMTTQPRYVDWSQVPQDLAACGNLVAFELQARGPPPRQTKPDRLRCLSSRGEDAVMTQADPSTNRFSNL